MDNIVCGRCSVLKSNNSIQKVYIFQKNINIFRNLELEIAWAFPAPNNEKYNWNNLAEQ